MFGSIYDENNRKYVYSINEICKLVKDGTHQTPEYIENIADGYKFLSSKDVMGKKIDWNHIKYISKELHEKLYSSVAPQKHDILMSKNGVNYGVAAVNDTNEVFDIYVSLALLRPDLDKVNPVYLCHSLNGDETKKQFDSSIKGIGVPNLHLGEIKKTKVLLPPLDLQDKFASFAQQIDKLKFRNLTIFNLLRKYYIIYRRM